MNCFNCGKLGHFARDCIESKVLYDQTCYSNAYVSSCLMLVETVPYWTVDSTTTDQISRDRNAFMDFRRIPKGSRIIYMGNNTSADVLGIGTCKLVMRQGRTLYFHDMLYESKVRQNLVSFVFLLQVGFKILFEEDYVNVLLDNVCYEFGFMLDGFIVLDYIPVNTNTSTFVTSRSNNDSLVHDVK